MSQVCDLEIQVNGQETFFLSEKILLKYSGKLRKIIKQEKRRAQIRTSGIEIDDFPGGPDGFELVSRFCYNNGTISITVSNVSLLHCCANFLGMTEKMTSHNLLHQTEMFLEGIFYWPWNDVLTCLKSCEPFFSFADSCSLLSKLMYALLAKIAQNSDIGHLPAASTSSTSSSPETSSRFRFSSPSPSRNSWWFEDITVLSPKMIDHFVKTSGCYGNDNSSLAITKFLLHYLKTAVQCNGDTYPRSEYSGLADTAVHGVIFMGKRAFSCRGLFWVLRVLSGSGLSRECRAGLEKLIAGMLDQATLDDLLVSGHDGGVYDVNLVLRLIRLFVHHDQIFSLQKLKTVGRLMDKYLREIAPDPSLKISKFLAVAESLPDCARDSFDGIYRAIDIFLESHPSISLEERSRICRCLNYEKLSLEACKDLAKNPRITPRVAVQALASQNCSGIPSFDEEPVPLLQHSTKSSKQIILYNKTSSDQDPLQEENEDMKWNIQKMQWRVVELEKVCQEMKGQMSRMVKGRVMIAPPHGRTLPRMC